MQTGSTTPAARPAALLIPSLDGLRAVAVLLVFLAHSGLAHLVPGGLGVTVFFFLSGYLITTLLRVEHARFGTINLRHFYLRRMVRIWPAFYVCLAGGVLLTLAGVLPGRLQWQSVAAQALHFNNYYSIFVTESGTAMGSAVFWSLAVEEHFYLLLPCIYGMLQHFRLQPRRQFLALALLCLLLLIWRCVLVFQWNAPQIRTYFASDTRFDSLLFGCALAVWCNPALDRLPVPLRSLKWFYLPAACLLLLGTLLARNAEFRETFRYTLQGVALLPIFAAAIVLPQWGPFVLLNQPWMKWLGRISYPFYLVHLTVIEWTSMALASSPPWQVSVWAFAIAVVMSSVIFRFVERPFNSLRKRLAAH